MSSRSWPATVRRVAAFSGTVFATIGVGPATTVDTTVTGDTDATASSVITIAGIAAAMTDGTAGGATTRIVAITAGTVAMAIGGTSVIERVVTMGRGLTVTTVAAMHAATIAGRIAPNGVIFAATSAITDARNRNIASEEKSANR